MLSMGKEYCLMNFTRLEGQLKVTKEKGDALEGSEDVPVCSLLPASLWRQVECSINDCETNDQSSDKLISFIHTFILFLIPFHFLRYICL